MLRILSVLIALAATSPALAGEVATTDCDRFAAHPYDPAKKADGVVFAKIDAGRALMSCASAFSQHSGSDRFKYQYGRALLAADRPIEAMIFLKTAADGGYAAAQLSIATILYNEDALDDEKLEAIRLFHKAAEQGHPVAQLRLAAFYLRGEAGEPDPDRALDYARRAADAGLPAAKIALNLMGSLATAQK
jgi:TPR repeat protein